MQATLTFPTGQVGGDAALTLTEQMVQSLASGRKGATRPTDTVAGEIWTQEVSETEWRKYLWTGEADILLFTLDPVALTLAFSGAVNLSNFTAVNDFIVGTGNGAAAKKTLAEVKVILGIDALPTPAQLSVMLNTSRTLNHILFGGA